MCAANHRQSAIKGRLVAIGVTDRRLLVLPIARRGEPADSPQPILPEQIASAKASGAGGGWATVGAAIAGHSAVKLDLRLKDGEKLKLVMMHGDGAFGKLGGGESQREGIAALAEWFGRLDAR